MTRASLAILVLTLATAAAADTRPVSRANIERDVRALQSELMAPCCFSQQVRVHHSEAADEVRRDLRARLEAGETRDEIRQAYVRQYGKRILVEPPAEGFDRLLYVVPPLALVVTGVLVVTMVRRFTVQGASGGRRIGETPPRRAEMSADEAARLNAELRDLD